MAVSLKASEEGLKKIEQLRREKGWAAADPRWCDAAHTVPPTLARFRKGTPVQQDTFINICQAVGAHWEDIVDRGKASPAVSVRWELRIEAEDDLKNAIFELLKEHSGDVKLSLRKLEEGSLIFVLEGSLEGFERMEYLFREGLVRELLGAPILGVRIRAAPNAVQLRNWLQGHFEAIWQQPPSFAFARPLATTEATIEPAASPISRAKTIQLGAQANDPSVQLVIKLSPQTQDTVNIAVQVHPVEDVAYLPPGLQLIVIEPTSGLYEFVEVQNQDNWVQLEIAFEPGETFKVQLQLGELMVTEDFIV